MKKYYRLTGSKEEMIEQFKELAKAGAFTSNPKGREYSLNNRFKRCDTVDGNPSAATKQCHPYTGTPQSCAISVNGRVGGKGRGTYGD